MLTWRICTLFFGTYLNVCRILSIFHLQLTHVIRQYEDIRQHDLNMKLLYECFSKRKYNLGMCYYC